MKKAAIFDMDGTLVDNSPVHVRAFEIFCARYGVTGWKEKLDNGFGMGNDDIMRLVMPEEVIREKDSRHWPTRRRPSTAKYTPRIYTPSTGWSNCSKNSTPRRFRAPWVRRAAKPTSISCSISAA